MAWPGILGSVLGDAVLITGFVFAMMLLVEYLNVATSGVAMRWLGKGGFWGYAAVILLGTMPGCLGAFTDVTLYIHRIISLGALAGSMVAASGDEAFVLLAVMPRQALLFFAGLFAYGLLVAWVVDHGFTVHRFSDPGCPSGLVLHAGSEGPAAKAAPPPTRHGTFPRVLLCLALVSFIACVAAGWVGPRAWNWIRVTILLLSGLALAVVATSPDHFLEVHLYRHVAREHVPRVFAWTFIALFLMSWIRFQYGPVQSWILGHPGWAVLVAALVGVLPESGPHLLFVLGYSHGLLPLSVLAASSIVQDGHGMLPLLAQSRREFLRVKAITLASGLLLGYALRLAGW